MFLKKTVTALLLITMFTLSVKSFSQSNQKYDYAEVIVLQKVAKKESVVKEIYLNSTTDSSLEKEKIAKIKTNSDLMKFMNNANWQFVNKLGSQPSNSGPIWISYTFRKKQ